MLKIMNKENSCIIIDFDGTITKKNVMGEVVPSIISTLRSEGHLGHAYSEAAYALEAKYRPMEIDEDLSFAEKFTAMNEWWEKHLDLLLSSGLHIDHLKLAANSEKMTLREGAREVFNFANENNIPVIIFSASGIGFEPIKFFLEKENLLTGNIIIVSNQFIWNEDGLATGRVEPLIHSLNKNVAMLKMGISYNTVKDKKFALVVGDNMHDAKMAEGIDFEKIITYGVVNEVNDKNKESFQKSFDKIILDGESLEVIVKDLV